MSVAKLGRYLIVRPPYELAKEMWSGTVYGNLKIKYKMPDGTWDHGPEDELPLVIIGHSNSLATATVEAKGFAFWDSKENEWVRPWDAALN